MKFPWISALAAVLFVSFLIHRSCSPAPPDLSTSVRWLTDHFGENPIGGGWNVSSIVQNGSSVEITISIPPRNASRIMRNPVALQRKAINTFCPNQFTHVFWDAFPHSARLWVLGSSGDSPPFVADTCDRPPRS